jgi:hypothetical protein
MLYTDSGSPIPNDKPMEQFKASEEGWRKIERSAENPAADYSRAVCELRDRVLALEAAQAPEASSAAAPPVDSVVDQNDRKWITDRMPAASEANFYSNVEVPASSRSSEPISSSGRRFTKFYMIKQGEPWLPASIEYYKDRQALVAKGYEQGLAAGRAEQGSSQRILDDSTPEPDPEPSDFQTLHGIALDMVDSLRPIVIPEILKVLRQAIREPMAEQQAAQSDPAVTTPEPEPTHPQYFSSYHAIAGEIWGMLPDAPEPNQATAGDGGLVKAVLDAMGEGTEVEARKAICKVAAWARAHDLNGMSPAAMTWEGVARWLEREANQ